MALKYILLLLLLLLLLQVNYSWGSQAPSLVYECQIFWEDEGWLDYQYLAAIFSLHSYESSKDP